MAFKKTHDVCRTEEELEQEEIPIEVEDSGVELHNPDEFEDEAPGAEKTVDDYLRSSHLKDLVIQIL